MKRIVFWGLFVLITFFFSSCYYDNLDELTHGSLDDCNDTSGTMSYTNNVLPVISNHCTLSCHNTSAGTNLVGYANVKTQVDNGNLNCAINHLSGCLPMPQGGSQLSPCNLKKINKWIVEGAPNN